MGGLALAIFPYPAFSLITDNGTSFLVATSALTALTLSLSCYQAPLAALFNELFPTRVRYSAVGFGYVVAFQYSEPLLRR